MKNEVILLVAGRGVQALLTIALFRVLTTLLSPADVGGVYLMISAATLFGMFLLNPVLMYLNRNLFLWHDAKTVFEHMLGYSGYVLAISALAFPVVLAAWSFLGVGAELPGIAFASITACYTSVLNLNQAFLPVLNTLGRKGAFVSLTLATSFAALLCSALFVRIGAASAGMWMWGQVAAIGAVTCIGVLAFLKLIPEPGISAARISRYTSKSALLPAARFAIPLSGAAFFMWSQAQSYRVLVEKLNGAEFLGYLAVGFSIATSVAGILESLVQQIYLPGFYRAITGGDRAARAAALGKLVSKAIPVYLIYLFFLLGTSEYLVRVLVSEKFRAVFVYSRYGAFIEFFRMTTNILASAAHSEMRTDVLIKPYFFGGIAALAGVYFAALSPAPSICIPLALLASGLLTLVIMWRVVARMSGLALDAAVFVRYALLSLAFLPLAFFHGGGFVRATLALSAAGAYFVWLQYRAAGIHGSDLALGAGRGHEAGLPGPGEDL
ncbi:MAG: oligosaccharide flippase family protein [Elusimicrobia bacterium]|nr:oligosaccharide flippase family protein [Elusimicrobiota bacterium]